jgi:RNA polymerase sigma factor (sigma-70 family)
LLRQAVRKAAAQADLACASDRELLRRFAEERDKSAFAALVRRHSALVLRVCRRVLGNEADAEDACQATFLVLARKAPAGCWRTSVANWLYTTARHIAANARLAAVRRARREGRVAVPEAVQPTDQVSGRELLAALEEELDRLPSRYREPLVLCYLEGLTRDEAATRLGVPADTVKTQLERGRKRLGQALTARGCGVGSGLLALAVVSPVRASPRLVQAILATVAGSPPAAVAALAKGVTMSTLVNRSLLVLLSATAVVCLGIAAWWTRPSAAGPAAEKAAPAKEKKAEAKRPTAAASRTLSGRVLGPDGKAVAGATILLAGQTGKERKTTRELARTDSAGRFRCVVPAPAGPQPEFRVLVARAAGFATDWIAVDQTRPGRSVVLRLGKTTVPIRGRVLTLEGRPVRGAVVRVSGVQAPDDRFGLKEMYAQWVVAPALAANLLGKRMGFPTAAGLPEKVTTDAAGRFVLPGVGDGRLVSLEIAADSIETLSIRVAVDPTFDPKAVRFHPKKADPRRSLRMPGPPLYGPTFDHTARPCRVITGTVVDLKTKKPLAGVSVSGHVRPGWWENGIYTKTDASGLYRLLGLPNAACEVIFGLAGPSAYLHLSKSVGPTTGLTPVTVDMQMVRGTVVSGRVTDRRTGKPIVGGVRYAILAGNKHLRDLPGKDLHTRGAVGYRLDADGRFHLVAPPGPGIIAVQADSRRGGEKQYPVARIRAADRGKPYLQTRSGPGDLFITAEGAYNPLSSYHDYRVIDVPVGGEKLTVDLQLDPGQTVTGKVVGPDGKPVKGATVSGLAALFGRPTELAGDTFTAEAILAEDARTVAAVHAEKKLAGTVVIHGAAKTPPVLRLAAWAALTGRLVDAEGKPIAGASFRLHFEDRVAGRLHRQLQGGKALTTDAAGRFRADVPFSGMKFILFFARKGKYLNTDRRLRELTCAAGATKDLGDVAVRERE